MNDWWMVVGSFSDVVDQAASAGKLLTFSPASSED